MNLSTNFVPGLIKATDKAIPGPRDTNIEVLPLLVPVHEPILPTRVLDSTIATNQESFVTEYYLYKIALDPAGSDQLCLLGTGLWTIDLFAYGTNIGTAGTYEHNKWSVDLEYQGYSIPLIGQSVYSGALQWATINRSCRFLFREEAKLAINWKAVGVGEATACQLSIVATRHL